MSAARRSSPSSRPCCVSEPPSYAGTRLNHGRDELGQAGTADQPKGSALHPEGRGFHFPLRPDHMTCRFRALETNKYNHITATYYLLAERILREKQEKEVQNRSSSPSNIKAQFRYRTKRFPQGSSHEGVLQKVPSDPQLLRGRSVCGWALANARRKPRQPPVVSLADPPGR